MKIAKAIVAGVGALVTVLTATLADDVLNASETGTISAVIVEQLALVYFVWAVRNKTDELSSNVE